MKSRLRLLIAVSLVGLQVTAQEKRPITLNEAIDLGLKTSKQLKNSQARIEDGYRRTKRRRLTPNYLTLNFPLHIYG
jgi:hypothetical protein